MVVFKAKNIRELHKKIKHLNAVLGENGFYLKAGGSYQVIKNGTVFERFTQSTHVEVLQNDILLDISPVEQHFVSNIENLGFEIIQP
jgi:hypothetical protein